MNTPRARILLAALLVAALPAGCARAPKPATAPAVPSAGVAAAAPLRAAALATEFDALLDAPALDRSTWGVVVQSLDNGQILYRRNATKLLMPASNMKIVTLAAAAERLGWDYRFETRLVTTGAIDNGVLHGDLVILGGGDPTFNRRHEDPVVTFGQWATALRAAGIDAIDGRIVGDDRLFAPEALGSGWAWDYLAYGYAAPVGALQSNEDTVDVVIRPGAAEGEPASVAIRQPDSGMTVGNRVTTGAAGTAASIDLSRLPGTRIVHVSGHVPAGAAESTRAVAVDDPAEYFARTVRAALEAAGIRAGEAVSVRTLADPPDTARASVLLTHRSVPLSEIARVLMKASQNLYAETLLRTLGAATPPATVEAGREAVRDVLESWGVPPDSFVQADGSGLSRYNYVTAELLVTLLRRLYADPRHRAPFLEVLPVAGVDGTLARRLRGTRAEGNVRAKTGSISNARALSGYVQSLDGEMLAFSILANNFNVPAATIDATTDLLVERLANFTRR
jgi:D-alanyl-D-alanine carboxypeptidase/D-alanyl-D-alanine-endopeptidase (penicillin-binding protein 4)